MFDPDQPFYETIGAAIRASGLSLDDVVVALGQRGYPINKGTLSRWTTGTQPTLKHLETLRCLPEALGLSSAQQAAFQRALNHWLGVKASTRGSGLLAYRENTLGTPSHFAGRTGELQCLQHSLTQRHSIAITGLGGIGKTSLAQQLLHLSASQFASGCEALVMHPGQTAVDVIRQVAHRLGLQWSTETHAATTAGLLDWLASYATGIDLVFLLDDVGDEAQIEDLVRRLPGLTWVITSRRPLAVPRVELFPLATLSNVEAADLLLSRTGLAANPIARPLALTIAARLGNLPLALSCAAGLAHILRSDLAAVLAWLDADGLNALRLDYAHLPRFFDRMLAERSPTVNALFELCGAFALPSISSAIFQALAERLQLHPAGLLALSDLSLIGWPEGHAYFALHSLVHEYAALRLRAAPRSLEMRRSFIQYYGERAQVWRHSPDPSNLQAELENVLIAADYAYKLQDWTGFRQFWSPVTWQLWVTGDKQRYVAYDEKFLEAARAQQDVATEAVILAELAWAYLERGDFTAADRALAEALALCDVLPDGQLQRARVLRYQAKIAFKCADPARALDLLQASEAVVRAQGTIVDQAARSLAMVYIIRAKIAHSARQGERAISNALTALHFCEQAGPTGEGYLASLQVDVGDLLDEYGDRAQAEAYWSAASAHKSGIVEDESIATAHTRLAYLAAMRGQKEAALRLSRYAHQIYVGCGAVRYHLRLKAWLKSYVDADEISPLLDLARLED